MYTRRYQELHATCVLLFLFTIFKYIAESSEYGVLVRTITRSAPNLLKFFVVFVVIAGAFTTMGLLLFGHTVKEWSSIWEATQEYTVMLAGGEAGLGFLGFRFSKTLKPVHEHVNINTTHAAIGVVLELCSVFLALLCVSAS